MAVLFVLAVLNSPGAFPSGSMPSTKILHSSKQNGDEIRLIILASPQNADSGAYILSGSKKRFNTGETISSKKGCISSAALLETYQDKMLGAIREVSVKTIPVQTIRLGLTNDFSEIISKRSPVSDIVNIGMIIHDELVAVYRPGSFTGTSMDLIGNFSREEGTRFVDEIKDYFEV